MIRNIKQIKYVCVHLDSLGKIKFSKSVHVVCNALKGLTSLSFFFSFIKPGSAKIKHCNKFKLIRALFCGILSVWCKKKSVKMNETIDLSYYILCLIFSNPVIVCSCRWFIMIQSRRFSCTCQHSTRTSQ